jgi:hypothetical protein
MGHRMLHETRTSKAWLAARLHRDVEKEEGGVSRMLLQVRYGRPVILDKYNDSIRGTQTDGLEPRKGKLDKGTGQDGRTEEDTCILTCSNMHWHAASRHVVTHDALSRIRPP